MWARCKKLLRRVRETFLAENRFHVFWVCWSGLGCQHSGHFTNSWLPPSVNGANRQIKIPTLILCSCLISKKKKWICIHGGTSAQSRLVGIFVSLTKNLYKDKQKKCRYKVSHDIFCYTDAHVFLTSLTVHVGGGYVLHPRIDMNCHPKEIGYMQARDSDLNTTACCVTAAAQIHGFTHTHTSQARFWWLVGEFMFVKPKISKDRREEEGETHLCE